VVLLRPQLAKQLAAASAALFLVGLVFRFGVYGHMYIAPDAPFGISDLIEAVLGFLLLGVVGLSVLSAIAMLARGPRENRVAGAWLLALCVAIVLLLQPLHNLAARWAI
jgi:hypothetical protein